MGKRAKRSKQKVSSRSDKQDNQKAGHLNKKTIAGVSDVGDKNQVAPGESKSVFPMVVEFIGAGLCGLISNNCFSTDHKIWGIVFSFGAVASFLALPATAIARNFSPKRTWYGYSALLVVVATAFFFWAYSLSKSKNEPTMADLGRGISHLETMAASDDSKANELRLYFSNQWQQSQQQLSAAQKALAEVQRATQPRRISPELRAKILKILLEHNNLSKTPIKVIVGKTDSETENFASQFREMLDAAGYGADAKSVPDEAYNTNQIVVTSFEPDVAIPPFNISGKNQELVRVSDFFVSPTENGQKDVDVVAVFSGVNGEISVPSSPKGPEAASVMVFYPNPKVIHDTNDIHYAYHPTRNPDHILMGVSDVLIGSGISVGPLQGKTILNPGEVGFFIPQKIY